MISFTGDIYVASNPIDMRLSFDRLTAIVREQLGGDPRGDAVFVFHNRSRTHVKILARDASGYWIHYKRLDRGNFRIPMAIPPGATRVRVERREMALLLEGINRDLLRAARRSVALDR